jgi:hypothetical protein
VLLRQITNGIIAKRDRVPRFCLEYRECFALCAMPSPATTDAQVRGGARD